MTGDQAAIDALLTAEHQRCAAIGDRDHDALQAVLAADLHYLHSTGDLEDRAHYIATSIAGTPRTVRRGELDVRIFGDIAVVLGDYEICIEADQHWPAGRSVAASGLQVWRAEDGCWRLWAHQGTAKPPLPSTEEGP